MNSFYKNLIGITLVLYSLIGSAQSKEIMAVLSDDLRPVSTNYIIYSETSNLIAQDISNRINVNAKIKALPVCNSINNAQKRNISKEILQFTKEYQYTYNLNYEILRKIANKLEANYILLITSSVDIETDFLKETFWNKIPLAGENSVNPGYKIITQITLVDPKNELILLEKNYDKCIQSKDFDLAIPTFSPSSGQLDKFKNYSTLIAKNATPIIENIIVPDLAPPVEKTFIEKIKYVINNETDEPKNLVNKNPQTQAPKDSGIGITPNPNLKLYNYTYENL